MPRRSPYSYLDCLEQNLFGEEQAAFTSAGTYSRFCSYLEKKFNLSLCMIIRSSHGCIFHVNAPDNAHILEAKNEQQAKLIARHCIERACVENNVVINCPYEIVFSKTGNKFTKIRIQ